MAYIDRNNEDAVANRLVLGLAAHPLNSCNPPPPELPDLLDALIASEARLEEQVSLIEHVDKGLARRIQDLQKRVHQLRVANSQARVEVSTTGTGPNVELLNKRRMFEAQDRVLLKMCAQVIFIHATFTQKIRGMAISAIRAHRDIFAEFLGERHNHPGIQVANSSTLSCAPGCNWYQKHGPYEWSRKPYSNSWWEEMNNTDWDWVRMKEHFAAAITIAGGKVMALYQLLQANSMRFVPSWFWSEEFESWTMHADMENIENVKGDREHKVVIKVRYNKPAAAIERERAQKLDEMKKSGMQEPTQPTDTIMVDIDPVGETIIDQNLVFDGLATKSTSSQHSQENVRWLLWWGFEKWHAELVKGQSAQQAKKA